MEEVGMENKMEKNTYVKINGCESKSVQGNRKRKFLREDRTFFTEQQCDPNDTDTIENSLRLENSFYPKMDIGGGCYSDVAIVPSRYPSRTFSKQEADSLSVQLAMGLNSKSTGYPRFLKHQFYCGAIVVTCLDDYSKNWLIQRTEECSPWEKTPLRNCDISELERSFKIEIHITDPIPAPEISMKWLANQNPDLDTSRWLILEEKEHSSKRHFVFKVPESSFRTVEKNQMILYHGFDVVDVKCLGEMKDL